MTIVADTHTAIKEMVAAGIKEPHAEAIVKSTLLAQNDHLATKDDIKTVRSEMESFRREVFAKFESVDLKFDSLESRMLRSFALMQLGTVIIILGAIQFMMMAN